MPRKPKAKSNEESQDIVTDDSQGEIAGENLNVRESIDESQIDSIVQLQETQKNKDLQKLVSILSDDLKKVQTTLVVLSNNMSEQKEKSDNKYSGRPNSNSSCKDEKHYFSLWKDVGGTTLSFYPGGSVHPMSFLKKLSRLLDDAAVPEAARLRLALGCLRGSAAEWGEYKEDEFNSFDEFVKAFKARYWDADAERALFKDIIYGKYRTGSRADYFLGLAKLSHFLNHKMTEKELIDHLVQHFSSEPELKRSIVIQALNTVEQVEIFLRKIDETDVKENDRGFRDRGYRENTVRRNANNNYNQNRDQNRNFNREKPENENVGTNSTNREDGRRENTRETIEKRNCNVVEKVYAHRDEDFFSDVDEANKDQNLITPVVSGKVGECEIDILIDSGSQVSAISEKCLKNLNGVAVAKLPVSNVSVKVAVGAKEQRVTQQVLLAIKISAYDFEIPLLVIPKLNRDLILGCDWLSGNKVQINFYDNSIIFPRESEEAKIYFYANHKSEQSFSINFLNCENDNKNRHQYAENDFKKVVEKSENFPEKDKQELLLLLNEFSEVFSETPGRTNKYEHQILLRD